MSSTIELKPMEMPFSNDPLKSYTMPAKYYIDSSIAEQEKRDIFWNSWVYVAHKSHLSNAGDYYCCSIHGQEIVLIKESDSQVRGFYNVCAHRGHQLLTGSGQQLFARTTLGVIVIRENSWVQETLKTWRILIHLISI